MAEADIEIEQTKQKFAVEALLFGKWSYEGVECPDPSLADYLSVKSEK